MKYFDKIKQWAKKEKYTLLASLLGGVTITVIAGGLFTKAYSETIQEGIADSVVRFHVLANSDTKEDQELKLCVRDAILERMTPYLENCANKEETRAYLEENLETVKETALAVIKEKGYSYDVSVSLSRDLFPVKKYGDIVFPSGMYDALRVEIGEGEGKNWWCVMFPPLCFVDVSCDEVTEESKNNLKNILTEEEYQVISAKSQDKMVPEMKFKVVEWWQEQKADESYYVTNKDIF